MVGVLAPNAKLRKFVVLEPPENEDTNPCGHSIAYEQATTGRSVRGRWISWATMLLRVFAVDVLLVGPGHCTQQGSDLVEISDFSQLTKDTVIQEGFQVEGALPSI